MSVLLVNANALEIPLADESVQMVATSPPYFSLRDYNIKGQLGLESTYQEYVENMVRVFQEVRRVLRPDGVAFLNLGDSYAGSGGAGGDYNKGGIKEGQPRYTGTGKRDCGHLKAKDLIGIPWRVALALQDDGWWLRSDIIWSKKNCMPESVTDRFTRSHEYIFLLAKSERYFFDACAIREGNADPDRTNYTPGSRSNGRNPDRNDNDMADRVKGRVYSGRNRRTVWEVATTPYSGAHFATWPPALVELMIRAATSEKGICPTCKKPWTRISKRYYPKYRETTSRDVDGQTRQGKLGTKRFDDPIKIATLGWRPSCRCYGDPITKTMPCANCEGTGREMVYKTELERRKEAGRTGRKDGKVSGPGGQNFKIETGEACPHCEGTGAQECQTWPEDVDEWPTVPCVVLDPFAGSGTTLMVARKLGRSAVGLDLSFSYLHEQARQRLSLDALDEWENGIPGKESDPSDLPMFAGLGSG